MARVALAPRRPRVAPTSTARTGRFGRPERSAPRMARVASAPRKPRVAPYRSASMDSPWILDGVHPGRPGRLWPPGIPGLHQHQRLSRTRMVAPTECTQEGQGGLGPQETQGCTRAGLGGLDSPWPFPSAPRMARVAKAPRRPRVAPGGTRWVDRPPPLESAQDG